MSFTEKDGQLVFTPAPDAPRPRGSWFAEHKIATSLLVFVAAVTAVSFMSDSDTGSGSGGMAQVMCQDFVKDRLKSPSSADFSGTRTTGTDPYTVTGKVDSDNSFGASLRSTYTCRITQDSDGGWRLLSLGLS